MMFSIVIPCYNEKDNISLLLDRFSDAIGDRKDVQVVLVNNGSTDGSGELMSKLIPSYLFVKRVDVPVNKGYGYGILEGLRAADGDYLGWTHADLQTDPSDVIKAVDILKKFDGNVYVKGNRKGRRFFDVFFTFGMSVLEFFLTGRILRDINAQPNMFSRSFFESWESPPNDFALDLYAFYMAKKRKYRIIRFPVRFPDRIHGESKWNTGFKAKWKFIKRTMSYSFRLARKGVK